MPVIVNFYIVEAMGKNSLGGVSLRDQVGAMLRGQVADIIFGSIFLFIGLAVCSIAAIRRQRGVRIFVWLGIWSAITFVSAPLTVL